MDPLKHNVAQNYLNYVFLMQDDIVRVLRLRDRHRLMAMSISHIVYMSTNLKFPPVYAVIFWAVSQP